MYVCMYVGIVLSCFVLRCIVLHCIVLRCIVFHCVALPCIVCMYVCMYVLYGKHFFGTSFHFFWTWTLVMDLSIILLEMATLLFDLRAFLLTSPFPSVLLDLALSQTIPPLDRFPVSVQPRLDVNSSDSRGLELH